MDKLMKWLEDKHDEAKRAYGYYKGMEEEKDATFYWGQLCAYREILAKMKENNAS